MELTINIPPEEVQRAAERAARDLLAGALKERLISTQIAAELLGVSENQFLEMARLAELERVVMAPRLKRWRHADVLALMQSFPTEKIK